jgi:2-oxoisovalerate dehydrogenase E1 component
VRSARRPAILHIECERLLGHAGSDVDTSYRTPSEIEAALARDPLLHHARALLAAGHASPEQLLELDRAAATRVDREAERAKSSPRLTSRGEIMKSLVRPYDTRSLPPPSSRKSAKASPKSEEKLTLAQGINRALAEILEQHPQALLFGEDVAKKGGVYGLTKGLFERFGALRVFNTLLDEQTILGLALGSATLGLLPIPEIQYLAYLHNAEDQLRGEAATFRFFANGELENPSSCASQGSATRRASAGTSTTTTRWPCCATSPASPWPFRPARTTRSRCFARRRSSRPRPGARW